MTSLSITPDQKGFTEPQIAVLRTMGADKATAADLAVFFHTCTATGLDPFRKQVYLIGRYDSRAGTTKFAAQTSIDGYRIVAARTGTLAGIEESWETDANGRLVSATVVVRKVVSGIVCAFSAVAHWNEYVQTTKDGKPMGLWAKLPHRMLAKCAEANALRRAFPEALGGLYTAEEMPEPTEQPQPAPSSLEAPASVESPFDIDIPKLEPTPQPSAPAKAITAAQVKRIHAIKSKLGIEDETYRARLRRLYDVETSKDLTAEQAADLIKRLEEAAGQ